MSKLKLTEVHELSEREARATNGGGATYEYGKDAGAALASALTFGPVVAAFEVVTDWYYGV